MNEYKEAIELDEIRREKEIYNKLYSSYPNSVQKILNNGVYLNKFGVNSWALSKEDAITVTELLSSNKIKIVGVDIIIKTNNDYEYNYDNCSFELDNLESYYNNYLNVVRYINNYRSYKNNVFFIIIPSF